MLGVLTAALLIVNVTVAGVLALPAASVALTEIVCDPWLNAVLGVQLHAPFASAVAVHTGVVPSSTVIWLDASAVPAIVGVVSLIVPPDAGLLITGAAGAVVSTVRSSVAELALTLPAASVDVATRACDPSLKAVEGVQLHAPFASAVAVQIVVLPSLTATLLFASAVPLTVGVVSLVTVPETGLVTIGAEGGV